MSEPDQWPPAGLAEKLDQSSLHQEWPGDELEPALGPEGVTQLTPAPTAQEVSPAVLRVRYGAAAAQGGRGDGDPGSP